MDKRFIAAAPLALALSLSIAPASALAQQPGQQPEVQAPKPAPPRLSAMDMAKRSVQRMGAQVDASRSTPQMIVSNYTDPKGGKTTIVVLHDRAKNLLGLYVYNFGNLKDASNREEIYRYLLAANDAITIGGFFVDSEDDIGYKYLMNIGQSLNQAAFESSYLMMAAVARDRRAQIRKLLGLPVNKEDKPADVKKAAEGKPPGRESDG